VTVVGRLLGVGETTVDGLVAAGDLPAPLAVGKGSKVWDWRGVAYYRLKMEMLPTLARTGPDDPGFARTPAGRWAGPQALLILPPRSHPRRDGIRNYAHAVRPADHAHRRSTLTPPTTNGPPCAKSSIMPMW